MFAGTAVKPHNDDDDDDGNDDDDLDLPGSCTAFVALLYCRRSDHLLPDRAEQQ